MISIKNKFTLVKLHNTSIHNVIISSFGIVIANVLQFSMLLAKITNNNKKRERGVELVYSTPLSNVCYCY